MKLIQETLRLSSVEYNKKHLEIISSLLPTNLTATEIKVLACFMALDKSIIEEDMFNTYARKVVREKLGLSHGGLGNHLKSMIEKFVLDKNKITGKITMKDFLIPQDRVQGYQIKIIKDEEKDRKNNENN